MSRTVIALLLALTIAAPVAATQYLRVINAAATPIIAVAAVPTGSHTWSALSLADAPLQRGGQLGLAFHGNYRCRYDLRVVYADGRVLTRNAFNLCRASRYVPTLRDAAREV